MLPELEDTTKEELVADILGLNELERSVYFALCSDAYTVKELVELTGRTRSVVQRAIQSLQEQQLITREGRVDKTVYYVYIALPFETVREQVKDYLNAWYNIAMKRLG